MPKKPEKTYFVSETSAFEDVAIICLYWQENTCQRQSME